MSTINTHHVCFSNDLACSGANPCRSCRDVVERYVLVLAMKETLTLEQGGRFFQAYERCWAALFAHMQRDPEVARRAVDVSRLSAFGGASQLPPWGSGLPPQQDPHAYASPPPNPYAPSGHMPFPSPGAPASSYVAPPPTPAAPPAPPAAPAAEIMLAFPEDLGAGRPALAAPAPAPAASPVRAEAPVPSAPSTPVAARAPLARAAAALGPMTVEEVASMAVPLADPPAGDAPRSIPDPVLNGAAREGGTP